MDKYVKATYYMQFSPLNSKVETAEPYYQRCVCHKYFSFLPFCGCLWESRDTKCVCFPGLCLEGHHETKDFESDRYSCFCCSCEHSTKYDAFHFCLPCFDCYSSSGDENGYGCSFCGSGFAYGNLIKSLKCCFLNIING